MEVFAIILGAFIGGASTIAAAFITRGFVIKKTETPTYKISGIVKKFIKFFSIFKLSNVVYLELKNDEVYTDEDLGITYIATMCSYPNFIVDILLPGKKEAYLNSSIGRHLFFKIDNIEYRLIVLGPTKEKYSSGLVLELRKTSSSNI